MFMNILKPRVARQYVRRLNQRGDTIVEVLLAMAVMSLVLVGAYVTTNKNEITLQNSQEREQAQRLVEGQIEMLRAQGGIITSGDCFNSSTETSTCGNFTAANSGAVYTLSVTGPTGTNKPVGTYTLKAVWTSDGALSENDSNVTLFYRLN
jgi:prepilin-type N-terminal cleavage/methylation domain-containing protein